MVDMFVNAENVRIFAEVFLRPKYGFFSGQGSRGGVEFCRPSFFVRMLSDMRRPQRPQMRQIRCKSRVLPYSDLALYAPF